ncbi:MAG: hypothetical protein IKZ82_11595 [Clostridia bacterium]|nr:hypothetical protein [Clostridia bacterium]
MEQRGARQDGYAAHLHRERGKVTADHIRVSRSKKERTKDHNALKNGLEIYGKYAEKQANEALGECHDWSIFENVCQSSSMSGKLTGTAFILKAIAKMRPVYSVA